MITLPIDKQIFNCHSTDTGNAQALSLLFEGKLRYVHGLGWHSWNGNYWKPDSDGYAVESVKMLAAKRQELTSKYATSNKKKELMSEAFKLENAGKIENCLKMAESIDVFSTSPESVDTDPMLLACPNGTVDLEIGKLRDSDPNDLITACTDIPYDPDKKCPLWISFLQDIFITKIHTPDYQFIGWLQKVLGYVLTGSIAERSIYICYGEGANGKSTFLDVIRNILGSYSGSAAFTNFLESKSENSNDIARLRGARFVTAVETGPGKFLDEIKIKQITGGDPVTCRFLYKEFFTYKPTYKIFLGCNYKPRIKGTDNAIWDRIKVLPFNVRFKDEERDKKLQDKLMEEAEGILAWMVEGCVRWQIEGLEDCKTVKETTDLYRNEEDSLGRFLQDKVQNVFGGSERVEDVWQAYNQWAKSNGEAEIQSAIALGIRMKKKGYHSVVENKVRVYKGITL